MFLKKGGEVFPDLSGDGKVTRKDILMGRGVIPQNKNRGGLMRHDERTIRNVDDEIYRIAPKTHSRGRERIDAREEYARDLREKDYLRAQMNRLANGGQPMPMMDPAMMQPPMPMLPAPAPEQQVQLTEASAAQQGEALGQEYLDEMMTGIDTADSTEELIDAIRGDDRSLQDRYDELANFVGERDASATPESVLTLVQPTIMMTEQGAMDSGIGELMQGITGEVEMETEMGAPTPMGQGVGELMMTESVEEVIPEMNAGGPVQRLANGGPPDLSNIARMIEGLGTPATEDQFSMMVEDRLPIYQRLLGDTGQTQRDLQSKLYFDIAQAGLNLASGTDPRTGQSMAGKPLASQLAAAAQPVAASAAQQAGQLRNVERAAALGALQSAESAEAARLNAERQSQLALLGGGLSGLATAQDIEGRSRLLGEDIEGRSRIQGEGNLAAMKRQMSQQDFRMSLQEMINDAQLTLQDEGQKDALERAAKAFGYEGELMDQRGQISTDFLENEQAQQLLIQSIQNEDDREAAREQIEAQRSLNILNNEANLLLRQTELDAAAEQAGLNRTHDIIMQQDRIAEQARQFDKAFDDSVLRFGRTMDLEELTQKNLNKYRRFQSEEAEAQRLATVGGYGTGIFQGGGLNYINPLAYIPIIKNLGEDSALRQNADALRELDTFRRSGNELAIQEFEYMRQLQSNAQFLDAQQQLANQELANRKMDLSEFQAITKAIQDQQRDLTSIFGNSYEGTIRGLLSDQSTLDDYAAGTLDDSTTNVIDQAILVLQEPRTVYDPATGLTTTRQTDLPRAVQQALYNRTYNDLPLPNDPASMSFNPFKTVIDDVSGLLNPGTPNYQTGGEVTSDRERQAMERLNRFLGNTDPSLSEPAARPGRIVDETIDFETTTGLPTGFSNIANTLSDTVRDVTGLGPGPLFPDVERGGEQLRAVANMTQRFIRDSVAGRPFAVEIEAMAEEIAQPGAFRMDERNLVKLQTMRSQLLEIGDMAQEILKNPQGFDQKSVISAREDLQQLSPLVDNYNKIIKSYEIGLGKEDKPDPSMFERGLGNAQGNVGQAILPSRMLPFPGMEDKIPIAAALASQGGPINRRRS